MVKVGLVGYGFMGGMHCQLANKVHVASASSTSVRTMSIPFPPGGPQVRRTYIRDSMSRTIARHSTSASSLFIASSMICSDSGPIIFTA